MNMYNNVGIFADVGPTNCQTQFGNNTAPCNTAQLIVFIFTDPLRNGLVFLMRGNAAGEYNYGLVQISSNLEHEFFN